MASQAADQTTTTISTTSQDQDQPQDQESDATTATTTTEITALKDQLTQKDARIKDLEQQLLTQSALGELYFQWGQDSDALLRQAMRLLKAKGREIRKLKMEILKGQVTQAKTRAVAEVLVALYGDEGEEEVEGEDEEGDEDEAEEEGG